MSWLSYVFPLTILRQSTKYNRDIRINEERGNYKLLVNGSRQSGEYIKLLWLHAFKKLGITADKQTRSILVLGVAGGTVIHILRGMYTKATIAGVDIDNVMIDIGKTYFGLKDIPRLLLVHQDAKQYIQQAIAQKKRYDLIIVDLFSGREIPGFVAHASFLRKLRTLRTKDGRIVINYLRELAYQKRSDRLMKTLKKLFSTVVDFGIYHNRFFAAK